VEDDDREEFLARRRTRLENLPTMPRSGVPGVLQRHAPLQYSYNFDWLGVPIIEYPQDIVAMQELCSRVKPDLSSKRGWRAAARLRRPVRAIVGHTTTTLYIPGCLDNSRLLLARLPRGTLGRGHKPAARLDDPRPRLAGCARTRQPRTRTAPGPRAVRR
jgi:hypothetical protein